MIDGPPVGKVGSPRGFFRPQARSRDAEKGDVQDTVQFLPRFQPENLQHNANLFERVHEIATKKGCTPSQLALAWVPHQGKDVCPIPGTTKIENLNQNIGALSVTLTSEEMAELEHIASKDGVKGDRYADMRSTFFASGTPALSSWKAE